MASFVVKIAVCITKYMLSYRNRKYRKYAGLSYLKTDLDPENLSSSAWLLLRHRLLYVVSVFVMAFMMTIRLGTYLKQTIKKLSCYYSDVYISVFGLW